MSDRAVTAPGAGAAYPSRAPELILAF